FDGSSSGRGRSQGRRGLRQPRTHLPAIGQTARVAVARVRDADAIGYHGRGGGGAGRRGARRTTGFVACGRFQIVPQPASYPAVVRAIAARRPRSTSNRLTEGWSESAHVTFHISNCSQHRDAAVVRQPGANTGL